MCGVLSTTANDVVECVSHTDATLHLIETTPSQRPAVIVIPANTDDSA